MSECLLTQLVPTTTTATARPPRRRSAAVSPPRGRKEEEHDEGEGEEEEEEEETDYACSGARAPSAPKHLNGTCPLSRTLDAHRVVDGASLRRYDSRLDLVRRTTLVRAGDAPAASQHPNFRSDLRSSKRTR